MGKFPVKVFEIEFVQELSALTTSTVFQMRRFVCRRVDDKIARASAVDDVVGKTTNTNVIEIRFLHPTKNFGVVQLSESDANFKSVSRQVLNQRRESVVVRFRDDLVDDVTIEGQKLSDDSKAFVDPTVDRQ